MSLEMKVRIAKNSGFCFGVKRAINMALEASNAHDNIVTLGPLIHNPQMVERLKKAGINSVNSISEISNSPVIIRSHGVEKAVKDTLLKHGVHVIDATCPYVSKTQDYAKELSENGYRVIIYGDANHPEVIAMKSYVQGEALIISHPEQLKNKKFQKVGVISQTTRNSEEFRSLVCQLVPYCNELKIINTICSATNIRQESTLVLAKISDLMIVIGGKNSSNTKMLANICQNITETHHIETEQEIEASWFDKKENVGITAGASTPDWIIVEVYNKIIECTGDKSRQVDKIEAIPGFKEERK
jgi:4-hydroxy-3-methylbut-2-enyl diphosphate reductase